MKKTLKHTHEITENMIETTGRVASDDSKIAENSRILGEGFEKFSTVCENIIKPLELVTSAMALGVCVYKSVSIRYHAKPNITTEKRLSKQHKRDTLALLTLGAFGLAVATFATGGIAALALAGGGYCISTLKAAYRQNRYQNKVTEAKHIRRAIALAVSNTLDTPSPTASDIQKLSLQVSDFLAVDQKHSKQLEKRNATRMDLGLCASSALLLIAAAVFPPITAPLAGIALVAIAAGAASKLKKWVSEKFITRFKSEITLTQKTHHNKYERLDEMLNHITPKDTPNREKRVSFVSRIEKMMSKVQHPQQTHTRPLKTPKDMPQQANTKTQSVKSAPKSNEKAHPKSNLYHTDIDLFEDLEILDHRQEDHPRYEQYQKTQTQEDDIESPVG